MSGLTLGQAPFEYETVDPWPNIPAGWTFLDVAGVLADGQDRIFLFSRGDEHQLSIFDTAGNLLDEWPQSQASRAHALALGIDDSIFLVDDVDHVIRKYSLAGELLLTIGTPNQPAPYQSGEPFNRVTDVAVDRETGDLFVADGYGNSRVHRFSADGVLIKSWGRPGSDPGEFNIPHNIVVDRDGFVYVADRENHRIQVFDREGVYQTQFGNLHRPACMCLDPGGDVLYVGQMGPSLKINARVPNVGPRIDVLDRSGNRLSRLGCGPYSDDPGEFVAPHSITIDSAGDLYLGEAAWNLIGQFLDPPKRFRPIRKLVRAEPG